MWGEDESHNLTWINASIRERRTLDEAEWGGSRITSRTFLGTFPCAPRRRRAGNEKSLNWIISPKIVQSVSHLEGQLDEGHSEEEQFQARNQLIRIWPTFALNQFVQQRENGRSTSVVSVRVSAVSQQNHQHVGRRGLQSHTYRRRWATRLDWHVNETANRSRIIGILFSELDLRHYWSVYRELQTTLTGVMQIKY